mmetsp:Transcript_20176/g.55706  ORF Transcript_20176/g.55706 Transcript_20176/m.55706 type:complete len:249 (+) Transcript_20176:6295-7041(+)
MLMGGIGLIQCLMEQNGEWILALLFLLWLRCIVLLLMLLLCLLLLCLQSKTIGIGKRKVRGCRGNVWIFLSFFGNGKTRLTLALLLLLLLCLPRSTGFHGYCGCCCGGCRCQYGSTSSRRRSHRRNLGRIGRGLGKKRCVVGVGFMTFTFASLLIHLGIMLWREEFLEGLLDNGFGKFMIGFLTNHFAQLGAPSGHGFEHVFETGIIHAVGRPILTARVIAVIAVSAVVGFRSNCLFQQGSKRGRHSE